MLAIGLSLVLGGALGNVIDRVMHGYVVDFIYFHWRTWDFPAFNVADTAISIGAGCLLLDAFRERGHGKAGAGERRAAHGSKRHADPARKSPRLLRRRRSGDRHRRARDRAVRRADLRASRSRAQPLRRGAPAQPRRGVRRRARRSAGRRDRDLQCARRLARGAGRSAPPRAQGVRCHVSAGDEGAHGSGALRARGPRSDPDRPRRTSGSRRHDGAVRHRVRRAHPAGGNARGCGEAARSRDPSQLAFVTQTTLSVDDTQRVVDALRTTLSDAREPAQGRHLLRDAESPGRREAVSPSAATSFSSSARRPARIRIACAKSPRRPASRAI